MDFIRYLEINPVRYVVSTSAQRELVLLTHNGLFWGSLGGSVASHHTCACVRAVCACCGYKRAGAGELVVMVGGAG